MSMIVSPGLSSHPVIGWQNLLASGTVTASNANVDYPVENVFDNLEYDYWKATATGTHYITAVFASVQSVGYLLMHRHNLHLITGSYKLQYSTNFGVDWLDATALNNPIDSAVVMEVFDEISASYWRLQITGLTGIPQLAMLMFGPQMVMPRRLRLEFTPPGMGIEDEITEVSSETGILLGVSVTRHMHRSILAFANVSAQWVRDYWMPFMLHVLTKPFAFAWNYNNQPTEVCIAWRDGDKLPPPIYSKPVHMDLELEIKCKLRGD